MAPQLSVELTGDEVRLFKSLQKIVGQQKKMEDGFGKVKKKADDAGKTSKKAFGNQALKSLAGYAAGMISISSGIQIANSALQHFEASTRRAMDQTRNLADARRRLAQVGGGDAGTVSALNRRADAAAATSGVDRATARQILFSARSEGFEDDFERILSFAPLINPEAAATVAGRGPGLFKGQITPTQSINATFAAAEKSNLGFEEIARALPIAAEGAALNQGDPTETIAALSVLAGRFKSADPAATAISTFASRASLDERTQGQGILDAVRTVQALDDEGRRDFLGESKELNRAFQFLSGDLQLIEQRMVDVTTAIEGAGTDDSVVMRGVRSNLAQGEVAAFVESERARVGREIAEEQQLAQRGFALQAGQDDAMRRLTEDNGITAFDRFVAERAGDAAGFLGVDPETAGSLTEGFGRAGTSEQRFFRVIQGFFSESNKTQKQMLGELQKQSGRDSLSTRIADP